MAYTRVNWEDLPSQTTPVNATNLNNMENGIEYNDQRLNGTKPMGSIVVDDITGKNLFDGSSMIELNGQVRRYSDGVIVSVSGYYGIKVPVKANTTYIVSSDLADRNKISNLCYFNGGTYISGVTFDSGSLSFTTPNNCNYVTLAVSNEYTWLQIELGTEATDFVEYKQPIKQTSVGVKESTTFYADDFKCRNMLGFSNIRNGIYKIGDGTYDGSGTTSCCTASKIEIDNTKNYVLSTANTQTTSYMYVMYYDASGTYLGYINTPFSTGFIKLNTYSNYSNAKYVNFRFDVPIANLINPQLEIGSEATPYTPYKNFDNTDYVLWTNSSPTSNIDNATNFNLSSSNYNYYEIIYNLSTSGTNISITTGKIPKGKGTILSIITSGATSFSGLQRNINYTNDTTLSSGQPYSFNNTSRTIDASVLIPIMIIGYK